MRTVETTGVDIEEAIEKGLQLLDVARENVIVEIIEEPKGGLLGIGSKEAVVRLTTFVPPRSEREKFVSSAATEEQEKPAAQSPSTSSQQGRNHKPRRPQNRRDNNRDNRDRRGGGGHGKPPHRGGGGRGGSRGKRDALQEVSHIEPQRVTELASNETEIPDGVKVGAETLGELLDQMGVKTPNIQVERIISNGDQEIEAPWLLHIHGEKLGMLIGRRGETLAALEYLTRLIASRDIESRAEFAVDVENYRARREVQLNQMAHEKADEAVRRNKTIYLEPMSPSERRLVHMFLREHPAVYTESKGDGNRRRVTIVPKDNAN